MKKTAFDFALDRLFEYFMDDLYWVADDARLDLWFAAFMEG